MMTQRQTAHNYLAALRRRTFVIQIREWTCGNGAQMANNKTKQNKIIVDRDLMRILIII